MRDRDEPDRLEADEDVDESVVAAATDAYVAALCDGRFADADKACSIAFGAARIREAEDPTARSRW